MRPVCLDPAAVTARLTALAAASDLERSRRLSTKVDLSPAAVTRRLRVQSRLRAACLRWVEVGRAAGLHRGRARPG